MSGFASTQTFLAKGMTMVQNVGLKLLTTFGSMAVTFAVSAAANALVKYLADLAEAEEKARDAAIDSGKELDSQTSSIDSYKTKIKELKESLDSGTLSEQDAYAAKKELISIQDELVQKYPEEASGIDLVNGSLETQLQLLQGISDEKARAYLDDTENAAAISAAQNAVGNRSYNLVRGSNFDLDASEDELTRIKELAEEQGMDWDSDTITYKFNFTGDASEAESAFTKFIDSVKNDNTIDDKTKEALGSAVTSAKSILADAINNDSDLAEFGAKYQIQTNETWSKIYSDLEDARKSYNDAVAADDDEAIALALKKVKSAKDAYLNDTTGFADSYAGNVYTQKLIDQIDESTRLQAVQTALTDTFKTTTNAYKECQDAIDGMTESEKQYGNISNVNRDIIHWNAQAMKDYHDQIEDWGWNEDGGLEGSWSTVLGDIASTKEYGSKDDKYFAFSALLQTDDGLVPLTVNEFDSYIERVIDGATDKKSGKIDASKMLELDASGFDVTVDGVVTHVSNMLAAVEGQIKDGTKLTAADVAAMAGYTEGYFKDMSVAASEYCGKSMHELQATALFYKEAAVNPLDYLDYEALGEYLDVTDHKAEQLTKSIAYNLNELSGLDDINILDIGSLEKAGSASKKYTNEQIAAYNRLNGVANQLGISMSDLIDIFVRVGVVSSDNIKYTNEFTSSALTMATAASKAVSSVTSILNAQGTGTNVDSDSYSELIKDNAEYAAALQYTNSTMQLNREMAQKLTDAKVKESEAYIKVAYSQNQVKYEKVKNDLSYYTDEVRKSIEADADKLKQFDEEKAALESQSEALRDNCRSLQMQYSALMQASSAYQDWLNAQNATESGDMYDSAIEAKKALAEGLKNGKIGTVKWQAASEFLIPDDYEGTAAEYIKKLNRYFKQKSDGSDDGSGINNFITDSLKAGLMKQESDGSIKILADKTTEDFAKALKLSPDAVQSIFGEMQEYGWTFDWGSMLGDPITNYKMQLDDIKDQMADLEPDSEAWQVLDAHAKELENALDGLYQRSGLDQLADTVQKAKDNGVELDESAQQAAEALDSAARVQNELDIYDKQQEINEQQKNLTNTADFDNLAKLNQEMTELLQKRQQMGEPTDTEIELYLNQHADSNGDIPSDVIDKMKKAGVIKVDTETDEEPLDQASQKIDVIKTKTSEPVTLTLNANKCISDLGTIIKDLDAIGGTHTVTVNVKQTTVKSARTKTYAEQQTAGAYGGAFAGGRTLVGELGNELVVNPHSGKWYTVGDNGAEFVNLPKDAIVFDHSKTKKLLDQGFIGGRGVALASGTAMDSGSPGMGSYVGGSNGYRVGQDPRVKATYQSTKATQNNTKAVEENKKALEKQKKALEKQKDALEKESNKLKIYGQAAVNEIEKRITALNKEKDAQDKVYDAQIKELEKRKTALQKANDEEDRAIKLSELQDALEKAKANRTVRIYNKNEGFVWRADQQAVSDAQNDLDDQKRTWKNDDILQAVDDEIERINNLKDAYDESIEAQIDDLEAMKDKWDEIISLIGTSWDDYQAQLAAAAEFNGMSLDSMGSAADAFKDRVIANMKEIGENSDAIDQVTEAIEALDEATSNGGGGSNNDASAGFPTDDGSDIEAGLFDNLSEKAKKAKEEIDNLADAYQNLGDKNEHLEQYQLALLESISNMTVGTQEYNQANQELQDLQQIVGDRYTQMADYAEQYREKVLANNDLTWEQKTSMLDAMNEIEASYCTGYDTIDGLIQHYSDNLMNATGLTSEQYQEQLDALISFSEQHGASYSEIADILEAHIEAVASDTDISNEARQSQMDSLIAYAEQYGISEDSIIGMLADAQNKLIESGATSEEIHATMQETVAAACDAMNSSYQSTIDKVNAMIAVIQRAVEEKKKLGAMSAVDGAAGGRNLNTVARYASGIIGAATTHIAITDEQGPEIKMRKPAAGNYSLIERGTSVIPAQPSANIWKMGIDPDSFISQHMPQRSIKSVDISTPDAGGVSVSVGDIQMYGVNDVESFGKVIHERVGTIFAQEFSRH